MSSMKAAASMLRKLRFAIDEVSVDGFIYLMSEHWWSDVCSCGPISGPGKRQQMILSYGYHYLSRGSMYVLFYGSVN